MTDFAVSPDEYFGGDSLAPHLLLRQEQEALQLGALQARFAALRDRIPPLKALADAGRVDRIDALPDAVPLLFPHTFYKSFPQHLIHELRFDALGEWLGRLSTGDLGQLAGRRFDSVDAWLDAADADTGLEITHSSGTTGALSLYPRGKDDTQRYSALMPMLIDQWLDPLPPRDERRYAVIWPSYAGGRSAALKGTSLFRNVVAADPSLFYPLIPETMSTDWQLYILQLNQAAAGKAAPPNPGEYLKAKIEEAADLHRTHPDRERFLLDTIRVGLSSTPVVIAGGPLSVHNLAKEGLRLGMEPGLAGGSILRSFGGLKGHAEPDSMMETILRFAGVDRIGSAYGMTEVLSPFNACASGNYHIPPWVIPYALHETTGEMLPRDGVQRGRAAYFDLLPRTYWGGVISADRVEMSFAQCACGRTTPHVAQDVARVAGRNEEEQRIGPASHEAIHSALHALNWDLG